MGLLFNVTAFLRPDQEIDVKVKSANAAESWPVRIKLGPGGEDTIDIFAGVLDATRLRDALTEALEKFAEPAEPKVYRCRPSCCTYPAISSEPLPDHVYDNA